MKREEWEEEEEEEGRVRCFQFCVCVSLAFMTLFHYNSLPLTDYDLQRHKEVQNSKR